MPEMPAAATPVVELRDVNKRFGDVTALADVSLTVGLGEVVVVLGPSGSGKSTMCRTINRMEVADSGTILVDGEPQPTEGKELYRFRTEVGMVFQSFNLFAHRTVLDNVTIAPRKILGKTKSEARARAHELLDLVGIRSKADALPSELSGGQAQRVAIARAVAMGPKVILFDEPTSALDPESTQDVLSVMRTLADQGTTMLVVTHEMSFARSVSDRIIFMAAGRILETSEPEEFFSAPKTGRATEFLSKVH